MYNSNLGLAGNNWQGGWTEEIFFLNGCYAYAYVEFPRVQY